MEESKNWGSLASYVDKHCREKEKGGKKKMRDPLYSFGEAARPV